MRNAYTSKQTIKCSTHITCRIFRNVFYLDTQNYPRAKTSKYNKKMSTTSNANVASQNNMNPTATATQKFHHLQINHPLSSVPQNYSNTLAITEHISQGRSYPQSPVSHIGLHKSTIDDTC